MKKLFFLTAVALFAASCNNSAQSGYSVKGKINNAAGKELLLSVLGARSMDPVDTVKIGEDGTYEFSGTAKTPEFYAVSFLNTQEFISLVIDSVSKIELNSDTADFSTKYTVKGSKDSELLQKLNVRLELTLKRIDSLGQIYRENMSAPNFDSIETQLNSKYEQIIADQKGFNKKIIEDNPNSISGLMALSQSVGRGAPVFSLVDDEQLFLKTDENLTKLYPKSNAVKSLHDYLVQYKAQKEAEKNAPASVEVGAGAPEIDLPSPDGKNIALKSLRGNYVLLDFWAAWCRPCRGESPTLVSNYAKYKGKGFTIYQVSLDQTKDAWTKAIADDKLGAWNHVSDLKYWECEPAKRYGVSSIPANFLLDPSGKIVARDLRGPALGQKLKEIYGF